MNKCAEELRAKILDLVHKYYAAQWPRKEFVPDQTLVPVSGRVFDAHEVELLVDSALDFWLTTGRFADQFEREFARLMGVRHALLVNSGVQRQSPRHHDPHGVRVGRATITVR